MDTIVIPVRSKADMMKFIKFPWSIYKGNNCWVPPLIKDMFNTLYPARNPAHSKGDYEIFLALAGSKPTGRIYASFDPRLNEKKNIKMGYFSLFECIDNNEVARQLFDAAFAWLREKGLDSVIGPVSTTGTDGDEYKGLLIDCFDRPPVIMNSYNPPYYARLIESCGFVKDYDVFAYYVDKEQIFLKNPSRTIEYAQKRYDFHVDTIDLKNLEKEIADFKHVMDLAIPDEWPDLAPPSLEDVRGMANKLLAYADPDFVAIARSGNEAIGFGIAIPDYNQVLIHMNGRMTPLSIAKYLWYKRKIKCARFFVMFVLPAFRSKGASYAIYYKVFKNGIDKGYTYGEGSTIGETNLRMRADIESIGGQHYKTYRIFRQSI